MPLLDHNELLLDYLDSEEAIAEYLSEAIETGHNDYIRHAEGLAAEARKRIQFRAVRAQNTGGGG